MDPKWEKKWEVLQETRFELQDKMDRAEEELAHIAAQELLQYLAQGTWKWTYGDRLTPADSKAQRALVDMLSTALKLNHHDSFTLMSDPIWIEGFVDDGELLLKLSTNYDLNKEDADVILKATDIDIDLTELFEARIKQQLEAENQKLENTKKGIKRLENELSKLREE